MTRVYILTIILLCGLFSCMPPKETNTYILVHGAYHGKWCWNKIVPLLEADSHQVIAIDLPSHGNDTTPAKEVTLASYIDKVSQAVQSIEGRVILVGHSLGGMTISSIAEKYPDKIKALVYLTAVLPLDGESAFQMMSLDPNPSEVIFYEYSEDQMTVKVVSEAAKEIFYSGCQTEDIENAYSKLSVQAVEPFMAPVTITEANFGRVPKFYIETVNDKALNIELQRLIHKRTPCEKVFTLETGHFPSFEEPKALAEILLEIG